MQDSIVIPRWFDRHLHLRVGDMMKLVLPCTINQRATGALIMPNTDPPNSTLARSYAYEDSILSSIPTGSDFLPIMSLYLTDTVALEAVADGFKQQAWRAVKLYLADRNQKPGGGTTNSSHGVKDLLGRYKVFEMMEKLGVPLLGHFEAVEEGVDEFDREVVSIDRDLLPILNTFPGLKIVFEHITHKDSADLVASGEFPNLYATVTAHHLIINRNAMYLGGMNPVHYCKPVAKREKHRLAIRKHITTGPGKHRFAAGTDSAPYDVSAKSRSVGCAAGIFTAPCAVELYTTVFVEEGAPENLGPFMSENFLDVYGMKVSKENMTIVSTSEDEPYVIPERVGNVRVFKGGEKLGWRLVG